MLLEEEDRRKRNLSATGRPAEQFLWLVANFILQPKLISAGEAMTVPQEPRGRGS